MFNSLNSVTVPAKIGHKNIKIVTDVIDSELPFLLNKNEMKMAKAKVDFDHDILNIIGQNRDYFRNQRKCQKCSKRTSYLGNTIWHDNRKLMRI